MANVDYLDLFSIKNKIDLCLKKNWQDTYCYAHIFARQLVLAVWNLT